MIRRGVRDGAHSARAWGLTRLDAVAAAIFAVSIIAFIFGETLNSRHLTIVGDGAETSYDSYWYTDEVNGGDSQLTLEGDRPLSWTCNLTRTYEYGYCGLGLLFDRQNLRQGIDLSRFDSIAVKLAYRGRANLLRLSVKNSDPSYELPDGSMLEKVNQATVNVKQGMQVVRVDFGDFAVPEWWKDQSGVTAAEAHPEFHNVIALEVITGVDSVVGEHRSILKKSRSPEPSSPPISIMGQLAAAGHFSSGHWFCATAGIGNCSLDRWPTAGGPL